MSWSFKIIRIAGTEIRVHGTFLLLLIWCAILDYQGGGIERMFFGALFILLLFTCVLLHELGHATAAKRYGIRTPDITLLPIGGVARLEKLPDKPLQEIVVALAGPAVNVLIAAAIIGIMKGEGYSKIFTLDVLARETTMHNLLPKLLAANMMLVMFNLIPAFPMDGGRVLRAALACCTNWTQATVIAARIGQGIAVLFGIVGLLQHNIILPFIALFIFLAARQEMRYALLKQVAKSSYVGQAMLTRFLALPFDLSIEAAAQEVFRNPLSEYPLVDNQLHLRGMVFYQEILKALQTSPLRKLLEIGFCPPAVRMETPCWEALELMQSYQTTVLPVINPKGQVVGVVSLAQLSQLASEIAPSK